MSEILINLATYIEKGKINISSPFPPDMKGQKGADELTRDPLENLTTNLLMRYIY